MRLASSTSRSSTLRARNTARSTARPPGVAGGSSDRIPAARRSSCSCNAARAVSSRVPTRSGSSSTISDGTRAGSNCSAWATFLAEHLQDTAHPAPDSRAAPGRAVPRHRPRHRGNEPAWPAGARTSACTVRRWLRSAVRPDPLEELAGDLRFVALEVDLGHRQPGVEPPKLEASETEQISGLADGVDEHGRLGELAVTGGHEGRDAPVPDLIGDRVADGMGMGVLQDGPRLVHLSALDVGPGRDHVHERQEPDVRWCSPDGVHRQHTGGGLRAVARGSPGARSTRPRSAPSAARRRRDGPGERAPATPARRRGGRSRSGQSTSRRPTSGPSRWRSAPARAARGARARRLDGTFRHAHRSGQGAAQDLAHVVGVPGGDGVTQRPLGVAAGLQRPRRPFVRERVLDSPERRQSGPQERSEQVVEAEPAAGDRRARPRTGWLRSARSRSAAALSRPLTARDSSASNVSEHRRLDQELDEVGRQAASTSLTGSR